MSVATVAAYIAVASSALVAGGPLMLSALMAVSSLVQFVFISRLSLLRRVMTPLVAGTVLMLLPVTVMPRVLATLPNVPEGSYSATAPILAASNTDHSVGYAAVHFAQMAAIFAGRSGGGSVA